MHVTALKKAFLNQQWWGKVLGGICGYLIMGPAGAVFGILIGNVFDKGLASHLVNAHLGNFKRESIEVRQVFYASLFRTLGHLAKGDGRISKREIDYARFIMKQLKLTRAEKISARDFFNQGKHTNFNLSRVLTLILGVCKHNPTLLQLFVETCFQMAVIDDVTTQKKQALNTIFFRLGYKPYFKDISSEHATHYQKAKFYNQRYQDERQSHLFKTDYQILDVKESASLSEVKTAYRKKMAQYHPDRLIAQGANEREIKHATHKSQEIQAAYNRLKVHLKYTQNT